MRRMPVRCNKMKPYAFSFAVDFLTILYFLDGSTVTDTHSPPL